MGSELAKYLREAHHGGGSIEQVFARAEAINKSARNVTGASADMGYLTLFIYETMHESVAKRFRNATDGVDPDRVRRSNREVTADHHETLVRLVNAWKSGIESSTVTAMKVTPPLGFCSRADGRPGLGCCSMLSLMQWTTSKTAWDWMKSSFPPISFTVIVDLD